MDAVRENHLDANIIYACGPTPMLRAIKAYAAGHGIECYISLEEHMACGMVLAWAACVKAKKRMRTAMCITNGSARTDRFSWLRRWKI